MRLLHFHDPSIARNNASFRAIAAACRRCARQGIRSEHNFKVSAFTSLLEGAQLQAFFRGNRFLNGEGAPLGF